MSVLTQSCLFTAQNQPLFDASKKRRVTQEDIGNALGIAPTTVDRCLKGIGNTETISAVKAKADELGYVRVDKWASIKPEFILGYDESGQPNIDEQAVCILRQRGNHARNIEAITGLSRKRIKQILERNGLNTKNLQRIEENGLSLRQRHEIKMLEVKKEKNHREKQFIVRGSELRKNAFLLIKKYKNGISIEQAARELCIERSLAFWMCARIKSYKIIQKRKNGHYGYGERYRAFVKRCGLSSQKYKNEFEMYPFVLKKIKNRYPFAEIKQEATVLDTYCVNRIGKGYRADFLIKFDGRQSIAVEVKHKTTSNSFKALFGQVLAYKASGLDVVCVLPEDAFCPPFAKSILNKNNVEVWTV